MLAKEIIFAIRNSIEKQEAVLHEPKFLGNEYRYLHECIDSTFVSSVGKFVERFENELASYTGAKHSVAVVNGTSALQIALILAGVKSGDEVLIPAFTFVATANAVIHCGATPHFIDSDKKTLGTDPIALRTHLKINTEKRSGVCFNKNTGRPIRALVPVHIFGHPCDLEGISRVAKDFNLVIVEDASESLGSTFQGKHTGTFGLLGVLSFNGNKTITTGGGGAILTDNFELAKRAKHITTTAKIPHKWEFIHDEIGYNFRMPNLNAALGCAQLEQLPKLLSSKRILFEKYQDSFKDISNVRLFKEPKKSKSNYWLQTLILSKSVIDQRDEILELSNNEGLFLRPAWKLINELKPYKEFPKSPLPIAESISNCIINLPSSIIMK